MVSGKRVLEIGGGMTALAGLGLAAAGIAAGVVVTDGHPDCVKNQVSDHSLFFLNGDCVMYVFLR
jgi:predicted nicotinamide N-methyase